MPVSPQDFALWSDLTGNPYPQTPAERMAMAPEVYNFTKNLGRRGGPEMSPMRRAVDVAGKTALAVGALAGAAYLGGKYLGGGDDGGGGGGFPTSFGKLGLDDEPAVPPVGPPPGGGMGSQVIEASGDITPPTTSDRFGQDVIANQTSTVQSLKGLSPAKPTTNPIEAKPATQSEVISSQQHFSPGTEEEMLGHGAAEKAAAFRKSKAYALMQQRYPGLRSGEEKLIGGGMESTEAPKAQPVVISEPVRPSSTVRVSKPEVEAVESAITEMARPKETPSPVLAGVGAGPSTQEIRDLDLTLARSMAGHTPEQREAVRNQMLSQKYKPAATESIVTTSQPSPVRVASEGLSEVKSGLLEKAQQKKASRAIGKRPAATVPGTEEHLVAQAIEHLEGTKTPVSGAFSQDIPGSSVKNITVYPGDQISVTYKTDPTTSYPFKATPEYVQELKTSMEKGHFLPGGLHSAGGFIQAGINMGLLK
jgi:hypothetical protein